MKNKILKTLTIAGFDNSGGAGLQADLKTFSAFGCYGMSVVTAIAAQNTLGVKSSYQINTNCIVDQLETIFDDMIPDAIKLGMLYNEEIIEVVGNYLERKASTIPIILDPVMYSASGQPLLVGDAINSLITKIIPLAELVTPNLPEALQIAKFHPEGEGFEEIQAVENLEQLASTLAKFKAKAILIKGGHINSGNLATDVLFMNGTTTRFDSNRIDTKNTHGTGCTLSAAITACLAHGLDLIESIKLAKKYIHGALESFKDIQIGSTEGHGPVNHFYHLWPSIDKIKDSE